MKGDCPAFATVTVDDDGRASRRSRHTTRSRPTLRRLPAPDCRSSIRDDFTVRLSGIGGTGVVTVSQILGTAAMLDGFEVRGLDQTGLSQKAGPVMSDVRMSRRHAGGVEPRQRRRRRLHAGVRPARRRQRHAPRGASPGAPSWSDQLEVVPTGRDGHPPGHHALPAARRRSGTARRGVPARAQPLPRRRPRSASGCSASTTAANMLMLGVAVQAGRAPGRPGQRRAGDRAQRRRRRSSNMAAFRCGRRWVDRSSHGRVDGAASTHARPETLDQLIDRLDGRPRRLPGRRPTPSASGRVVDGFVPPSSAVAPESTALTEAAARNLHKLMAYKDEYEVARLALLPEAQARYEAVGGAGTKVTYRLHPPMLRSLGLDRQAASSGAPATPSFKALRARSGCAARSPTRSGGPRCAASSGR